MAPEPSFGPIDAARGAVLPRALGKLEAEPPRSDA